MSALDDIDASYAAFSGGKQKSGGEFTRGLKQSFEEIKGTGYGVAGLAGAGLGINKLKQWGLENAQEKFDASEAMGHDSDKLENIEDFGSFSKWLKHGAGYVAGQAIPSIATGGVGAVAGKKAAEYGIKKAVQGEARDLLLQKGATRGALAGAAAASYGQEAGSIYPEMVKEGHDEPGRAALFAVPAAALDVIPEAGPIARLLNPAKVLAPGATRPGIIRNALTTGAKQAGMEGATEAAQSGIERAAEYKPLTDSDAISDYMNSAALGALGGGMLGAATARRPTVAPPPRIDPNQLADPSNETSLLKPEVQGITPLGIEQEFAAKQPALFTPEEAPMPFAGPQRPVGDQGMLFDEDNQQRAPDSAAGVRPVTPVVEAPAAEDRSQMITDVRSAYESTLASTGVQADKGSIARAVSKMTSGAQDVGGVVERMNVQIAGLQTSKKPADLARAETLTMWRDNLTKVPEEQRQPVAGAAVPSMPSAPAVTQEPVVHEKNSKEELMQASRMAPRAIEIAMASLEGGESAAKIGAKYGVSDSRVKELTKQFTARVGAVLRSRGIDAKQAKKIFYGDDSVPVAGPTIKDELQAPTQQALQAEETAFGARDADGDTYQAGTSMTLRDHPSPIIADASSENRAARAFKQAKGDVTKLEDHDLQNLAVETLTRPERDAKLMASLVHEIKRRDAIRPKQRTADAAIEEGPTELSTYADAADVGEEGVAVDDSPATDEGEASTPAAAKPSKPADQVQGKGQAVVSEAKVEAKADSKPKRVLRKAGQAATPAAPSSSVEDKSVSGEAKAAAEPQATTKPKSQLEQAGDAWNANRTKDHPRWEDLTGAQKKTFSDYGPENWTKEDVANEVNKSDTAKTPAEDIPPVYYSRVEVESRVYDDEDGRFQNKAVPANEALASIRQDITTFKLLLDCVRGR